MNLVELGLVTEDFKAMEMIRDLGTKALRSRANSDGAHTPKHIIDLQMQSGDTPSVGPDADDAESKAGVPWQLSSDFHHL